jgi:glycosyltransferase involved in cell wall biosynthesis
VDALCEAFGQTYVEALASGIPSIFTRSGIAEEFIDHHKNAYVVEFKNTDAIYDGLEKIWSDGAYRNQLVEEGLKSVSPRFENEPTIVKLKKLYNA